MRFPVAWTKFRGRQVGIVLQLENGPCPLIAVVNVLLLRGKLTLAANTHEIQLDQLTKMLQQHLTQEVQSVALAGKDEQRIAASLQSLEDVLKILPKLEHGLDVNVRFTTPTAMEFTPELALFDLAAVRLVHGWTVDPADSATKRVIGEQSYNQLVSSITEDFVPSPDDPDEVKSAKAVESMADKTLAQQFLNDTQSQLTKTGLAALHHTLADEELAVLFRNNHFSVLLSHNRRLYTLISDHGLVSAAPYLVWAYCSDIQGDHLFLDCDWKIPHPDTVAYYARTLNQPPPAMSLLHQNSYPAAQPVRPQVAAASSASSAAAATPLTELQQQQLFAAQNGLVWDEASQNYLAKPAAAGGGSRRGSTSKHDAGQKRRGSKEKEDCAVQ